MHFSRVESESGHIYFSHIIFRVNSSVRLHKANYQTHNTLKTYAREAMVAFSAAEAGVQLEGFLFLLFFPPPSFLIEGKTPEPSFSPFRACIQITEEGKKKKSKFFLRGNDKINININHNHNTKSNNNNKKNTSHIISVSSKSLRAFHGQSELFQQLFFRCVGGNIQSVKARVAAGQTPRVINLFVVLFFGGKGTIA